MALEDDDLFDAATPWGFLRMLWGGKADGPPPPLRCQIWRKHDKRSVYLQSWEGVRGVVSLGAPDVYTSVSLSPKDFGTRRRALASQSAGIAGLWMDIDVNGGPEGKSGVAPSVDAAVELAGAITAPSVLVNSGYGVQAWWLFDAPWLFADDDERAAAAQLAEAWCQAHATMATVRGFRTDMLHDLARLLRIPGTTNAKGAEGVPVTLLSSVGPRYARGACEEEARHVLGDAWPLRRAPQTHLKVATFDDAEPPAAKLAALSSANELFGDTLYHRRRDRESREWTLSEYDLSLASFAVQADWSDDEIASLIRMHRKQYGSLKGERDDYVSRTVRRARGDVRRVAAELAVDTALEDLQDAASDPDADESTTVELFNIVIGSGVSDAPRFVRLEQIGADRSCTLVLVMVDGSEVTIGTMQSLLRQELFRATIAASTGHLMTVVKATRWDPAVRALLRTRVVHEASDESAAGALRSVIAEYASRRMEDADTDEERSAAMDAGAPFMSGGKLYVHAASLATHMRRQAGKEGTVSDNEVRALLRTSGWERVTLNYYAPDGERTTKSYYAKRVSQ